MSSPNISFSTIPANIRKPGVYTEINTSLAIKSLPANSQKAVIIAQRTASGSVAANKLTTVFADSDAALYFGNGSWAHLMSKAALMANPYQALDVIAMDDSGSKATGNLFFTGTAGAAGSLSVWVDNNLVQISVSAGDTAAVAAAALYTALYAVNTALPVSAAVTGGFVNLTAKNAGTNGNYIPVTATALGVTGMYFGYTGMSSGAVDPDVGTDSLGTLSYIAGAGHNLILSGLTDATNLTKLKTHIDFVSNSLEQRPAICYIGYTDLVGTLANAETQAASLNDARMTIGYLPSASTVGAEISPLEIAAAYGAAASAAFAADPDANLDNVALVGIPAPSVADQMTRSTQENLLVNGVTPLIVGPGQTVQVCRGITTYTTNAAGVPDPSLLDLNTISALDYVRFATRQRLAIVFPRSKKSSRTAASVRSEVLAVLYDLEDLEIIQDVAANESGVLVENDLQDVTRLDIRIPTAIIPGLHILAERLDLILD